MKITVNGKDIPLDQKNVLLAKKVILHFLNDIKKQEEKYFRPTWYLTVLIVMHSLSGELLNEVDPENLQRLFEQFSKNK